eukprot:scaffold101164_cov33-Prasinocladus_malaysianus.AAC.2
MFFISRKIAKQVFSQLNFGEICKSRLSSGMAGTEPTSLPRRLGCGATLRATRSSSSIAASGRTALTTAGDARCVQIASLQTH